jgi:hypothetical protein
MRHAHARVLAIQHDHVRRAGTALGRLRGALQAAIQDSLQRRLEAKDGDALHVSPSSSGR